MFHFYVVASILLFMAFNIQFRIYTMILLKVLLTREMSIKMIEITENTGTSTAIGRRHLKNKEGFLNRSVFSCLNFR